MNAFADLVSLAGAGLVGSTYSVAEGNSKVLIAAAEASATLIHKNVIVDKIISRSNEVQISYKSSHQESLVRGSANFDLVILAAPFQSSKVNVFAGSIAPIPNLKKYVKTFVTFVEGIVDCKYFGISQCNHLPGTIVSLEGSSLPFRSLAVHGITSTKRYVYKLFSDLELSDETLSEIFSSHNVNSTLRYVHHAYPYLHPSNSWPSFRLTPNVFYLNAMETAVSCIECELVAANNVALLSIETLKSQ
jgi:hypothetical protein